jgi:hypothetical protein
MQETVKRPLIDEVTGDVPGLSEKGFVEPFLGICFRARQGLVGGINLARQPYGVGGIDATSFGHLARPRMPG